MEIPFDTDVNTWTFDTVKGLRDYDESQYLEYKEELSPSAEGSDEKKEWHRTVEREITAFANANGGIVVFGVADDGSPSPFERPDHEVKQSVTRLIQNTRPLVDVDIPEPIEIPSEDTDRIILPVRVHEATRKPVLTSDAAVYRRINDRKEPMSREQMESLFVEHDRRQQAIRQLEMEINRFNDIFNGGDRRFSRGATYPPNYHLLNVGALNDVLRENTHLYSDEDTREAISRVFRSLRMVEDQRIGFQRKIKGEMPIQEDSEERFYKEENRNLKRKLDRVEQELKSLATAADLQVSLLED